MLKLALFGTLAELSASSADEGACSASTRLLLPRLQIHMANWLLGYWAQVSYQQ